MGAETVILDVSTSRLAYLDDIFGSRIQPIYSDQDQIAKYVREADLVIGGVLIPGAKAPRLVSEKLISQMSEGSVVVDVAVDQGGCIETCRPTTHDHPTYTVHGVVHYCVANMPGAVAQTSTFALTNTTIAYGIKLADLGVVEAAKRDRTLALGVNTFNGHCTYKAVAEALDLPYTPLEKAFTTRR
jgi:alanine dehydrogenase